MRITLYQNVRSDDIFSNRIVPMNSISLINNTASYGTSPILNTLKELSAKGRFRPQWNLFLINVDTLIRNNYQKSLGIAAIEAGVKRDVEQLVLYINAYVSADRSSVSSKPVVCLYLPHYEDIPATYRKPNLPGNYDLHIKLRNRLVKVLPKRSWDSQHIQIDVVYIDAPGPWPHNTVISDLSKKYPDIYHRDTAIITHAYLDYHIAKAIPEITLLESFTGKTKVYKEFIKKVILHDEVPFNKYTHLLFGDKLFLKSQLQRGVKATVLRTAKSEKWILLSDINIAESIIRHKFTTKNIILDPKI